MLIKKKSCPAKTDKYPSNKSVCRKLVRLLNVPLLSPKRLDALREVSGKGFPRTFKTRWNFRSRVIDSVANYQDQILECLHKIQSSNQWYDKTKQEAFGLSKTLQDSKFKYSLFSLKTIFAHTDTLFNHFQNRQTTGVNLQSMILFVLYQM